MAKEREERAEREKVERERREKEKAEREAKEKEEREKRLAKEKEEREAREKERLAAQQRAATAHTNGTHKHASRPNAIASSSSSSSSTPVKQGNSATGMQRSPNTSVGSNINGTSQKKPNNKPPLSLPPQPLGQGLRPNPQPLPQQHSPMRPPHPHMAMGPYPHLAHMSPQPPNPLMFAQGQPGMMVPPGGLSPRPPNFGAFPTHMPNMPMGPGAPLGQSAMPRFPPGPPFDPSSFNRGPPPGVGLNMNNLSSPSVSSPIGPPSSKPKTPLAPTPSTSLPSPMLAPGAGRRASMPLDSAPPASNPGPITRPAPIARPTATASSSTNGEAGGSSSASPVRRTPSPINKALGSSALVDDDDEVVSAPPRRAPIPIGTSIGPIGSGAPGSSAATSWGASPSSPRTAIGSGILGAGNPWGPPGPASAPGYGAPGRPSLSNGPGSSSQGGPPHLMHHGGLHGPGGGAGQLPPPIGTGVIGGGVGLGGGAVGSSSMWGTGVPPSANVTTPDWAHPLSSPIPGSAGGNGFFGPGAAHLFMAQHNAAASSGDRSAS